MRGCDSPRAEAYFCLDFFVSFCIKTKRTASTDLPLEFDKIILTCTNDTTDRHRHADRSLNLLLSEVFSRSSSLSFKVLLYLNPSSKYSGRPVLTFLSFASPKERNKEKG